MSTREGDRLGDGAHPRVRIWAELAAAEAELHEVRAGLGALLVILRTLSGRADKASEHLTEAHRLNRLLAQRDKEGDGHG